MSELATGGFAEAAARAEAPGLRLGIEHHSSRLRVLLGLDVAMLVVAAVLCELGAAHAGVPQAPLLVTVAMPALVLVLLAVRGMYTPRLQFSILDDLRLVLSTSALVAMIALSVRAFVAPEPALAQQSARLWGFVVVYLAIGRIVFHWAEQRARRNGEMLRPTLIIGAGRIGQLLAQRLLARPELGLRPVGFLDKDPLAEAKSDLPVLGASWDLERVVREHDVEHVVVSFSTAPTPVLLGLVERAERLGVATSFVPRLYERTTTRMSVEHFGGLPLVTSHPADPRGLHFALKYLGDRIVSLVLLLLLAPVVAAAALATWLSLGRPIFFRQRRVGRDGVEFDMLKFRTMRIADRPQPAFELKQGMAPGGVEGSDRRSGVGRFLRRTSMDELPQLFNVLRGEMSLVGPRPERPEYAAQFDSSVYRYSDRHRVKSGITGWAQVHGLRGQTSIADRAEWDNYYIENFSLWLDLKILLLTVAAVFAWFSSGE